jgi:hypothetical protein
MACFGVSLRYPVVFMADNPDEQPAPGPVPAPEGRLDSWKEIAAYLGRGIRTVQRWEREEGCPCIASPTTSAAASMREEKSWPSGRAGDSRSSPPRPLPQLTRRLHPVSNESRGRRL